MKITRLTFIAFLLTGLVFVSCDMGEEAVDNNNETVSNNETTASDTSEGADPGAILSDGTVGNPVFTLTWSHTENNEGPDIDMWVIDPNHAMLSTSRDGAGLGPTAEGGAIDYDDQGETGDGDGSGPERAFWPAGKMPPGVYTYGIRYYTGSGEADYTFRVYKDGSLADSSYGTLNSTDKRKVLGVACNVPQVQDLCDLYNSAPDKFLYCQDLAYAAITGKASPGGNYSKADLKNLLDREGYTRAYEGTVPQAADPTVNSNLVDGDIIMFYLGDPPNDPSNAPHYAVVRGGKIWQILHWGEGGQLDGPRD
ncbi:MAG: hypothetical protein JRJ20_17825, partial [Deltaproteobacteria bacterium]|nr:hypothetical protein [Deltaproteobacteria bacterium]